jgi:hypothetical protein
MSRNGIVAPPGATTVRSRRRPLPLETMKTLNRTHLQSAQPLPAGIACGPLAAFPERIVQFGEGNFLRAFADWMIDELNGCGLLQSSVLVVQPIRQGLADLLNAQDGLYGVLSRWSTTICFRHRRQSDFGIVV